MEFIKQLFPQSVNFVALGETVILNSALPQEEQDRIIEMLMEVDGAVACG